MENEEEGRKTSGGEDGAEHSGGPGLWKKGQEETLAAQLSVLKEELKKSTC